MLIGENNKIMKSISSSGKIMFIDFSRDQHVYGDQLNIIVEFSALIKYNKINLDCQSWLHNNILSKSPNNPNINCSWIITREFGSYITLDFSFIEVKNKWIITVKMQKFSLYFLKIACEWTWLLKSLWWWQQRFRFD